MDGLFMGLIGGALVGVASLVGALFVFLSKPLLLQKFQLSFFPLRIDLFLGVCLFMTSIVVNKLNFSAFLIGVLFFHLLRILTPKLLSAMMVNDPEELNSLQIICWSMQKIIPLGLATGAALSFNNTGIGYSLLFIIFIMNLVEGTKMGFSFLFLKAEPVIATIGISFFSFLTIIASLLGGHISQQSVPLLSGILIFSSGSLLERNFHETLNFMKTRSSKLLIAPRYVNAIVVTFIFILWKELL